MTQTLLDAARLEIAQKSRSTIEEETAFKWAARSIAAYALYLDTRQTRWLIDCAGYAHEALEHAAVADSTGTTIRRVRSWIGQYVPADLA